MNKTMLIFSLAVFRGVALAQQPIGKVVDSYLQGTTTYMMIESSRMLNTSQNVYLHGGIPVVVREVMSVKEMEGVYYYRAYAPEKVRALPGENVFLEVTKKEEKLRRFENNVIFMKKKYANVTFVEGKKALINRGSLQNVDKRDVYRIYDPNGKAKGEIELYGVGDFLSAGQLRYPPELGGKWQEVKEEDSVIFVGNRKVVGAGLIFISNTSLIKDGNDKSGGGVFWSLILRKGNIFEIFLTALANARGKYDDPIMIESTYTNFSLIPPIYYRHSFFYTGLFSPFFSLGLTPYRTLIKIKNGEHLEKEGFAPEVGVGLEALTGRTVHMRVDLQYYYSPKREYLGQIYRTDSLFLLVGLSWNW